MLVKILLPALVAVVGILIYILSGTGSNPSPATGKVAEIGRITFFVGLFWTVAVLAQHQLSL